MGSAGTYYGCRFRVAGAHGPQRIFGLFQTALKFFNF
jgi:hypothetical protein